MSKFGRNWINLLKIGAVGLMFAPLWGFTWHKIGFNEQWAATWVIQQIGWQVAGGQWLQAAIYSGICTAANSYPTINKINRK